MQYIADPCQWTEPVDNALLDANYVEGCTWLVCSVVIITSTMLWLGGCVQPNRTTPENAQKPLEENFRNAARTNGLSFDGQCGLFYVDVSHLLLNASSTASL